MPRWKDPGSVILAVNFIVLGLLLILGPLGFLNQIADQIDIWFEWIAKSIRDNQVLLLRMFLVLLGWVLLLIGVYFWRQRNNLPPDRPRKR